MNTVQPNNVANESAISFKWLTENLARGRCCSSWQQVRDSMRATTSRFASLQDWVSDFWICKTGTINFNGLVPKWDPPVEFDGWPRLPPDLLEIHAPERARRTKYDNFARLLVSATNDAEANTDAAVSQFYELYETAIRQGGMAMVQTRQVRAWLSTAVGDLLSNIALDQSHRHDELLFETGRRLLIPRELKAAPTWGVQFGEGEIGILYNCRENSAGPRVLGGIRIGQGQEWGDHWQSLSETVDEGVIATAVSLAARLLRCRPLLEALLAALDSKDRELEYIALAVLRRWLLSLKAMAWLEDALVRPWDRVRPLDLACFAFNAVKPDWPRRIVALSHRSMDAKPPLQSMKTWRSSLFAIDANYAPSWETNTGMIWGLFAATPVLVRIQSPHYLGSEWCERESEMIGYLEQTCDFLSQRMVLDMQLEELPALDQMVDAWRPQSRFIAATLGHPEFPPKTQVYVSNPEIEWPLAMLRAAAALRIFQAVYGDAHLANQICIFLCSREGSPTAPAPTNNPGAWAAYRKLFRDLQLECGIESDVPPLLLEAGESSWQPHEARAFLSAIPDLSRGDPALPDVLAALEWRTTLLPILAESNLADTTLIDLRGLTRETWERDPRLSLARGIAVLQVMPHPIWFIQLANQRSNNWGLPSDRPIFTQYTEKQFAWMWESFLSSDWPDEYANRCGLRMTGKLLQKCRDTQRMD